MARNLCTCDRRPIMGAFHQESCDHYIIFFFSSSRYLLTFFFCIQYYEFKQMYIYFVLNLILDTFRRTIIHEYDMDKEKKSVFTNDIRVEQL